MITCTMVQHGCSKQTFQLVFVLSRNKVEENVILSSKIQLLKFCPVCLCVCLSICLSLSLSVCLCLSPPLQKHTTVATYIIVCNNTCRKPRHILSPGTKCAVKVETECRRRQNGPQFLDLNIDVFGSWILTFRQPHRYPRRRKKMSTKS